MLEDFRFACRNLSRSWGFWILSVLILGLGVGANTTMYSVIRGSILGPVERVLDNRTLVLVAHQPKQNRENAPLSLPELLDVAEQSRQIQWITGAERTFVTLTGHREAERLQGANVAPGFFPAISAKMQLGRELMADDSRQGRSNVIVLSDRLWRNKFAGDSQVIGRVVQLDGVAYTVVGVAHPDVWFPTAETKFWKPIEMDRKGTARNVRSIRTMVGLKPGVTLAQANEEITGLSRRWSEQYPETSNGWTHQLRSPYEGMVSQSDRIAITLVYIVTGAVLLIACANLANLLLARSVARRREMAVRLALGASRWRLLRLALIENLLLAVPAGFVSILLSQWSGNMLARQFPSSVPVPDQVVDWNVSLFTLLLAIASTVIFGIAPAIRAMKPELTHALKEGNMRSGTGKSSRRLASTFVIAQVAMALALVTFSGMLLRAIVLLHQINPGFQTHHMAMVESSAQLWKKQSAAERRRYFEELARHIAATPGVEGAGAFSTVPQVDGDGVSSALSIEGLVVHDKEDRPAANYIRVTPGAMESLRIPLLSGRGILNSDNENSPKAAVINQTMARKFWNGDALGKRFQLAATGPQSSKDWYTVVGIAGDVKAANLLRAPLPQVSVSLAQHAVPNEMTIIARTSQPEEAVLPAIRQAVKSFDADQPARFTTVDQENYRDLRGGRALAGMVTSFGILALTLSGVGLFALLLHSVRQRLPEIGIRMALGAVSSDVRKLVLSHALRLVGIGLSIGMILSYAMTRASAGLLVSMSRMEITVSGPAIAMLIFVTLIACWIPARLAAKADPASVLKSE